MEAKTEFKSTHNLGIEIASWALSFLDKELNTLRFRIGTCEGLMGNNEKESVIIAITNNQPGNGHLTDVFELFEVRCAHFKLKFRVAEVWNDRFKKHLLEKRGFTAEGPNDVVKYFK